MKSVGAYFPYEEERNRDLWRAFCQIIDSNRGAYLKDIYTKLVNSPSCRFWVSSDRATTVMSAIMRGESLDDMRPNKREMYMEIYRRVAEEMERHPEESLSNITFDVVNSPAPKFFLTPASAKLILRKIRKKWYETRRFLKR